MLFLAPADLRGLQSLDDLLARSDLLIAYGDGELRGIAAAALLFADYAVVREDAVLHIDDADVWAGVVWRVGREALRFVATPRVAASDLADAITTKEPQEWLEEWIGSRSVVALDAAAALIRSRGGDRVERAEFARLFAIGEPQKGLGAFLAKTKPHYNRSTS